MSGLLINFRKMGKNLKEENDDSENLSFLLDEGKFAFFKFLLVISSFWMIRKKDRRVRKKERKKKKNLVINICLYV